MNDEVTIAGITTAGAVIVAYIANVISKRRTKESPEDRMDGVFDGYERLIKRQEEALRYKDRQLNESQRLLERLQEQLDELRELTERQRDELNRERKINQTLQEQMKSLRIQYSQKSDSVVQLASDV